MDDVIWRDIPHRMMALSQWNPQKKPKGDGAMLCVVHRVRWRTFSWCNPCKRMMKQGGREVGPCNIGGALKQEWLT